MNKNNNYSVTTKVWLSAISFAKKQKDAASILNATTSTLCEKHKATPP